MGKRRNVVGVSWRRLESSPTANEGKKSASPTCVDSTLKPGSSFAGIQHRMMTRMMSFRDTFDVLRQKVKLPTHSRKRLTSATPSPFGSARRSSTPLSSQKTSARRKRCDIKMYSPFEIITPTPKRTPAKNIRMGTQRGKRFPFSTPGEDLEREVLTIADGVKSLTSKSTPSPISPRVHRSGIRTTPKMTSTTRSKKPLFV